MTGTRGGRAAAPRYRSQSPGGRATLLPPMESLVLVPMITQCGLRIIHDAKGDFSRENDGDRLPGGIGGLLIGVRPLPCIDASTVAFDGIVPVPLRKLVSVEHFYCRRVPSGIETSHSRTSPLVPVRRRTHRQIRKYLPL
jgi:hypothetical protein